MAAANPATVTNPAPAVPAAGDPVAGTGQGETATVPAPVQDDYEPFSDDGQSPAPTAKPVNNDGDEEIDEEQKAIEDVVDKRTAATNQRVQQLEAQVQIDSYLNSPQGTYLKDFRDKIIKVAQHPKAAGMKTEAIIASALGVKKLMELGAAAEKETATKAKNGRLSPSSTQASSEGGLSDPYKLSQADFAQQVQEKMQKAG